MRHLSSLPPFSRQLPCVLLAALCCAASAGEAPPDSSEAALEEVLVTGTRRESPTQAELGPTRTLAGEQLRLRVRSTLGATLEDELGVHNASFGPGVGLPVVRGLTGVRLRMLQNGLGTHDASTASPDHAVGVEPLLADEIRIVRGPDTIRHGAHAIGGMVEVRDNRIPTKLPERALTGAAEVRYGLNPEGHAEVFKLDAGAGFLAAHVDGFLREAGEVKIPGNALDREAVLEMFGDTVEFEDSRGRLLNSDTESRGGSVGASIVGDSGYIGVSVASLKNGYGIPPGGLPPHSDVPGQLPEVQRIRIDMQQGRRDVKAVLTEPVAAIEEIRVETGLVRYRHTETDNQFVATTFRNEVTESRATLDHRVRDRLPGTIGVQWTDRDFGAVGFETFVPESNMQTLGIFALQRFEADRFSIELGGRRETSRTRPDDISRNIGGIISVELPQSLRYAAHSAALALEFVPSSDLSLRLAFNRAQRAPDIQELLALGPHLSTRSFDIGNPNLEVETAHVVDFGIVWQGPWWVLDFDAYWRRIDDFIFLENQGLAFDIEEQLFKVECARLDLCVPVFGVTQRDALFNGVESRFMVPLDIGAGEMRMSVYGDFVRGYFAQAGAGDVPRLSPRSFGGALEYETPRWLAGMRATRAARQNRPGANETVTDGYLMLNAEAALRVPLPGEREAMLAISGRNLLNAEIRNATSFLRQFMPEPGRTVEFTLRVEL